MPNYQAGSTGAEVRQIQTALQQRTLYAGPIDGVFGGGTEAAVRAFQSSQGLAADGIVGPLTWTALFGQPATIPEPALASQPIGERCLALTGAFETSTPPPDCFAGLSGDFDGMGISFGVMQWNIGSGSLQPLLLQFDAENRAIVDATFGTSAGALRTILAAPRQQQLDWARSIQNAEHQIAEPWLGYFKTLGRDPQFIRAQTNQAAAALNNARALCTTFAVTSERALALMFDIVTQNGSISQEVRQQIQQDVAALPGTLNEQDLEVAKLRIVANRRADAANPEWREDVRTRKLTIADGSGTVHGRVYDLMGQFGIGLAPI
jgi:hypothetical protein